MSKKVPKLKMPLWIELVYFALIAVVPCVIAGCEIFNSHSSAFKITFSSIGSLLLVIIILRRFVLKDRIENIKHEIANLEHDYSIKVGDANIEYIKWYNCNLIIYIYNVIVMVFALVLSVLFVVALADELIAFKGAAILIFSSVLAALAFKIVAFLVLRHLVGKEEEDSNEVEVK